MRRLKLLLGVFLAVLIVACGGGGDPGTNSTSSTIPLFTTAPDTLTLAPVRPRSSPLVEERLHTRQRVTIPRLR
jgi:hypothetical protein